MVIIMARKLVYGVGVNDADYETQNFEKINGRYVNVFTCPYYKRWHQMLRRCYSAHEHEARPDYIGNEVCAEWHKFSNFKAWMERQDWEGKSLDKDLLVEGNRIYSPDNCIFISLALNNFFKRYHINNPRKNGTCWSKSKNKFTAQISNPITGKQESLGCFTNQDEANLAWRKRKKEIAIMLSDRQADERIIHALLTRFA